MAARKGKQEPLPGMEQRRITELHSKALEYVAVRDERMDLTAKEAALKGELLALMRKHKKDSYICEGVEIYREMSEETVKVKVHKSDEEDDDGRDIQRVSPHDGADFDESRVQ